MKNIFNLLFVMLIAMNFHSCDDWTEMETKNFEPEPLSEEYYAALREYKKVITPSHSDGSEAGHRKGQPRYTTV